MLVPPCRVSWGQGLGGLLTAARLKLHEGANYCCWERARACARAHEGESAGGREGALGAADLPPRGSYDRDMQDVRMQRGSGWRESPAQR